MNVSFVGGKEMDFGEQIHFKSVVKPEVDNPYQVLPFRIRNGTWRLIFKETGEVEDSGELTISEHTLDALICPQKPGIYILEFKYEIADEIWVDNFRLKVNGVVI